jgi:polar amino acid transport system substrate-binding protein/glutamate/aspartate transport system substrate-binding protein
MRSIALATALLGAAIGSADADVLERAKSTGELRIGYRADAEPFSFKNAEGKAAGYSVDLCKAAAAEAAVKLEVAELKLVEVELSAAERLDAIPAGQIDLLCEATTVTLGRREAVDFSMLTFATGASLLYPKDGASSFEELAGKKVGVLTGSTTETGLKKALDVAKIDATIVAVPSHTDGIERLANGEFAAYFGDGAILLFNLMQSPFRDRILMSDKVLSFEPYALALPKGDDQFRLVVDRALARLSRTGEIGAIFERNFGAGAKPSKLIEALWILDAVPE